jgi:hypothetical protein
MMSPKIASLRVWFWISVCICPAQSRPQDEAPLWTQPVLTDDLSRTSPGIAPSLLDGVRAGAAFLNTDQLMIYTVESTGHLSSRSSPETSSAFRLHVFVLDAKSGEVALTRDWGTRRHNSAVEVTTGGVLVKTGGIVKLYSMDFTQSRDLPLALDPNGVYFTSVSASGRTIAISHYFKKEPNWISRLDVLDAKTLAVRYSWDQYPSIFRLSMSDEKFATIGIGNGIVSLTDFGSSGRSKVVADVPSKRGCSAPVFDPKVVSDELILLRHCKDVFLLTVGGASSLLDTFSGNGSSSGPITRCEPYFGWLSTRTAKIAVGFNGRLVALSLPAIKVKKHLLAEPVVCLTALQVAVYDLNRKQRVLTVNVDPLPKNDYDFALSPDGSKLAILNDRNVSVYSVPIYPGHPAP